MGYRYQSNKRVPTRIRKLLAAQAYKCLCGNVLNNSNYFDHDNHLICGHCVMKSMGINTQGK